MSKRDMSHITSGAADTTGIRPNMEKKKNKKEKHIFIFLTAACEVSVITD